MTLDDETAMYGANELAHFDKKSSAKYDTLEDLTKIKEQQEKTTAQKKYEEACKKRTELEKKLYTSAEEYNLSTDQIHSYLEESISCTHLNHPFHTESRESFYASTRVLHAIGHEMITYEAMHFYRKKIPYSFLKSVSSFIGAAFTGMIFRNNYSQTISMMSLIGTIGLFSAGMYMLGKSYLGILKLTKKDAPKIFEKERILEGRNFRNKTVQLFKDVEASMKQDKPRNYLEFIKENRKELHELSALDEQINSYHFYKKRSNEKREKTRELI